MSENVSGLVAVLCVCNKDLWSWIVDILQESMRSAIRHLIHTFKFHCYVGVHGCWPPTYHVVRGPWPHCNAGSTANVCNFGISTICWKHSRQNQARVHCTGAFCMHSGAFCMHSGTFCMLFGTFCMPSGTFCIHSGTFWNILHAFCNILEHSACILHTFCSILEYSGTFWVSQKKRSLVFEEGL